MTSAVQLMVLVVQLLVSCWRIVWTKMKGAYTHVHAHAGLKLRGTYIILLPTTTTTKKNRAVPKHRIAALFTPDQGMRCHPGCAMKRSFQLAFYVAFLDLRMCFWV